MHRSKYLILFTTVIFIQIVVNAVLFDFKTTSNQEETRIFSSTLPAKQKLQASFVKATDTIPVIDSADESDQIPNSRIEHRHYTDESRNAYHEANEIIDLAISTGQWDENYNHPMSILVHDLTDEQLIQIHNRINVAISTGLIKQGLKFMIF